MIPARRGRETWILTADDRELVIVDGSGRDDWQAETAHTLSVDLKEHPGDLGGVTLRGYYLCAGQRHQIGTWVQTGLTTRYTEGRAYYTLSGVDRTALLSWAALLTSLTLPTSTGIAEAVRSLLATHVPGVPVSIPDTDETLRAPLTWQAGTAVLTVVNDLLAAAGYGPLTTTRDGALIARRLGERRPVAIEWRDDPAYAPFLPGMELTATARPNTVVAIASGTASAPGIVGRYIDHLDVARRGARAVTVNIEATSQEAADAQAYAHWLTTQARGEFTLTGPWQPLAPLDVAGVAWQPHDLDLTAEVRGISSSWQPSSPTTYKMREAL